MLHAQDWPTDQKTALLAAIVDSSDDAIVSKDLRGFITSWNSGAERTFGYTAAEAVGKHVSILIPPDREHEEALILERIQRGERVEPFETVRRRKDGRLIIVSLAISPVRASDGTVIGASKIARDVTERKQLEEAQRRLSREVNHRSKNILAIVESIIRQSARNTASEDLVPRISQRLRALAANQDLLIDAAWRGSDLAALARSQLGFVEGLPLSRVVIEGEALLLNPAATQAVGMALHELASNALRYGALSNTEGKVTIRWRLDEGAQPPMVTITWLESGGPLVIPPQRSGFGTTILDKITAQSLDGEVTYRYDPEGFAWELRAPASVMLATEQPPPPFMLSNPRTA